MLFFFFFVLGNNFVKVKRNQIQTKKTDSLEIQTLNHFTVINAKKE